MVGLNGQNRNLFEIITKEHGKFYIISDNMESAVKEVMKLTSETFEDLEKILCLAVEQPCEYYPMDRRFPLIFCNE